MYPRHASTSIKWQRVRKRRDETVGYRAVLGECAVPPRSDSAPHTTVVAKVGLSPLTEVASIAIPENGEDYLMILYKWQVEF